MYVEDQTADAYMKDGVPLPRPEKQPDSAAEEYIMKIAPSPERDRQDGILRTATGFSLVGLILSVFFGLGVVFSIIGTVVGVGHKITNPQMSKTAVSLGACGIVINVVFAAVSAVLLVIALFG